jgi:hypothetical protein
MELPPYHLPRLRHILLHTWDRLKVFLFRAGKVIVRMVLLLGFLNSVGRDGSFGTRDTDNSLLCTVGTAIAPVFEPMGVGRDNWSAAVSIFTGLLPRGGGRHVTSLYGQMGQGTEAAKNLEKKDKPATYRLWKGLADAVATIRPISRRCSADGRPARTWRGDGRRESGGRGTGGRDVSVFASMRHASRRDRIRLSPICSSFCFMCRAWPRWARPSASWGASTAWC